MMYPGGEATTKEQMLKCKLSAWRMNEGKYPVVRTNCEV